MGARAASDNFAVRLPPGTGLDRAAAEIRALGGLDAARLSPPVRERAIDDLKFSECLPHDLAVAALRTWLSDVPAVLHATRWGTRIASAR